MNGIDSLYNIFVYPVFAFCEFVFDYVSSIFSFNITNSGEILLRVFILIKLIIFIGFIFLLYKIGFKIFPIENKNRNSDKFVLSVLFAVFIWVGVYITTLIISASPTEFLLKYKNLSPFMIIADTVLKSLGAFLIFPFIFYKLLNEKGKIIFTVTALSVLFISVFNINSMVFSHIFNSLSLDLCINIYHPSICLISNQLLNLLICIILFFLSNKILSSCYENNSNFLKNCIFVFIFIGIVLSSNNLFKIYNKSSHYISQQKEMPEITANNNKDNIIRLSKNGKNVLFIFWDRAIGVYVPTIFNSVSKLKNIYSGFVFYPNTVSFYSSTILGYPPMIAGYEYTPDEMNNRTKEKMVDKHNEALLVLPLLFKNNGFTSTVIDPPYENYETDIKDGKIFRPYNIRHFYINKNINQICESYNQENVDSQILRNFFFFNIFVATPSFFKEFIYQNGRYKFSVSDEKNSLDIYDAIYTNEYSKLKNLVNLTKIVDTNESTFTVFNGRMIHVNKYDSSYSKEHYELEKESFLLFAEYIKFLKENGIYDNTRIIIVSDHGHDFQDNKYLNKNYTAFNPVLMIKDFNSKEPFKIDMTFMTNADAPIFAVKDIISKPVNPFSQKDLTKQISKDKVRIYSDAVGTPNDFTGTKCLHKGANYYEVQKNIFNDDNWSINKL